MNFNLSPDSTVDNDATGSFEKTSEEHEKKKCQLITSLPDFSLQEFSKRK